jgi:predicted PhzF superfamily epimerase YddE/YHI9
MFFEHKYAGNQLAVFLNAEYTENQMQKIAAEINLRKVLLLLK